MIFLKILWYLLNHFLATFLVKVAVQCNKRWGGKEESYNASRILMQCRYWCCRLVFALEYVMQHWKEDFMFGYQFLNGCNPVLIRRCTEIPKKLPVTMDMVECSLERNLTLEEEVKVGLWVTLDFICSFSCPLTSKPSSNCLPPHLSSGCMLVMTKLVASAD